MKPKEKLKKVYSLANKKAGRNIFAAIGVGLILGILAFLGIFVRSEILLLLVMVVSGFAVYEIYLAFQEKNIHLPIPFFGA